VEKVFRCPNIEELNLLAVSVGCLTECDPSHCCKAGCRSSLRHHWH